MAKKKRTLIYEQEKCTGCTYCVGECPVDAIEMVDGIARVDMEKCIACGKCGKVCPANCFEIIVEGGDAGPAEPEPVSEEEAEERALAAKLAEYSGVWVFVEQSRGQVHPVSWELLGEARKLADDLGSKLGAIVLGHNVDDVVRQSGEFGADQAFVMDSQVLADYRTDPYAAGVIQLIEKHKPEIVLMGATTMGRDLAGAIATDLHTGLTADCTGLAIDPATRNLMQTRPAFGGNIMATIVTRKHRPQMATVRPGTFREIPHNNERTAVVERLPLPAQLPPARVRQIQYERAVQREHTIENANVIVCGGRGLGNKNNFRKLDDLAKLLGGDVGATRPVVYAGWAGHDVLIGQAGKHIKPKILFSFGISGAIQHTAGLGEADFIVAVNKNPQATMMRMADVAVVADAADWLNHLVKELRRRIRE